MSSKVSGKIKKLQFGGNARQQPKGFLSRNTPLIVIALLLLFLSGGLLSIRSLLSTPSSLNESNTHELNPIILNDIKPINNERKKDFLFSSDGCLLDAPANDYGKHITEPPAGPMTIVCCNTTKGIINIAVHKNWAPIGAENFLNMVTTHFFSSKVGLFRALSGFLVQFGLAGNPQVQTEFERSLGGTRGFLKDDTHWLPLGPPGREINGVQRFQKGYMAYAGGGTNSRGTQLIMAFENNRYLGGGSPWEVPFGQLIGDSSYETMSKIYTGYGEKVSQGKVRNRGISYLQEEFPKLDYFLSCHVTAVDLPWKYVNASKP